MKTDIIGNKIIILKETSSTNVYINNLSSEQNLEEGTIVLAHYQTDGKGNAGNKWYSSRGKNLTLSVLLKPEFLEPVDQFYISKIIALSVKDFIELYLNNAVIKWPNDIYVNNAKIAGILIENSFIGQKFQYSVTGIGININQTKFPESLPNPTSLAQETGQIYNLEECLNLLCSLVEKNYRTLMSKNFTIVDYNYINQLYQLNEFKNYKTPEGILKAKITEVKKTGEIILKNSDGEEFLYGFKEIEYL